MRELLDINTHVVTFGNIHSFMDEQLSTLFFYNSIKCILLFLLILKEDYKSKPDYKEDLEEIFKLWQIL